MPSDSEEPNCSGGFMGSIISRIYKSEEVNLRAHQYGKSNTQITNNDWADSAPFVNRIINEATQGGSANYQSANNAYIKDEVGQLQKHVDQTSQGKLEKHVSGEKAEEEAENRAQREKSLAAHKAAMAAKKRADGKQRKL